MFRKKSLIILLGLCSVLIAVLLFNGDESHFDAGVSDLKFLPELKQQLADIEKIEIDSTDSVVLELKNEAWNVASKHHYPADSNSIRQLIYGMADLKRLEKKTADESLLDKIDLAQDSDAAVRVKLITAGNKIIHDVLFGKSKPALSGEGQQWFVRHYDDSQSWLVSGPLLLNGKTYHWLDKTLLSLDTIEIDEIVLHAGQDDRLVLKRAQDSQAFELQGKLSSETIQDYKIDEIIESIDSLALEDVRPKTPGETDRSQSTIALTTTTALQLFITVIDAQQGWISLQAESVDDDPAAAQLLNDKWSNWEFQIPTYKMDVFLQTRDDLIHETESS